VDKWTVILNELDSSADVEVSMLGDTARNRCQRYGEALGAAIRLLFEWRMEVWKEYPGAACSADRILDAIGDVLHAKKGVCDVPR